MLDSRRELHDSGFWWPYPRTPSPIFEQTYKGAQKRIFAIITHEMS